MFTDFSLQQIGNKTGRYFAVTLMLYITLTIDLNNNSSNHKHYYVLYCKQLPCGEILNVIYCLDYRDYGLCISPQFRLLVVLLCDEEAVFLPARLQISPQLVNLLCVLLQT